MFCRPDKFYRAAGWRSNQATRKSSRSGNITKGLEEWERASLDGIIAEPSDKPNPLHEPFSEPQVFRSGALRSSAYTFERKPDAIAAGGRSPLSSHSFASHS